MDADDTLNYMEKVIQGNPAAHNMGWTIEIRRRAADVRKEINKLRRFAGLDLQSHPAEYCLSRAQFLEDRLNDLLTIYQNQEG